MLHVRQLRQQQGPDALWQRVLLAQRQLEGIPFQRRRQAFERIHADVRFASLDFANILETELGEFCQLGLAETMHMALPLKRDPGDARAGLS